jgi:hypothetical protein
LAFSCEKKCLVSLYRGEVGTCHFSTRNTLAR